MTELDIAEGRNLEAAATPGPWEAAFPEHRDDGIVYAVDGDLAIADVSGLSTDAELIVWLRNNATALFDALAESQRMEATLSDQLSAAIQDWEKARAERDTLSALNDAGDDQIVKLSEERDALQARIADAPHENECAYWFSPGYDESACNCWKSAAPRDAVDAVIREAKNRAWDKGCTAGWNAAVASLDGDDREPENPYQGDREEKKNA